MQDAAIAEELQYLLGNISNRALFMRSLVRLKNWVPDMQNLQMLLKHIGKVKSVLGEFEACVKEQLHGDAHKSESVLDGIPGGSSAGASQDEEDKVEKKKDLSAVTVTRKSRQSSAASESESSEKISESKSENSDDSTKPRRRRSSRRKKKCEPEKMDSASEEEMELYGTAEKREGPGEDSSNPEEESGFDGIPGESSSGSSWDEGGEKEDKVKEKKDLSAVTVTRTSRQSSTASESESSDSESENSDDNNKPRRRNLSRKTKKCEPEKIDYASEVEMELYGTAEKREEPGEESSNPEEESGFDGIPGDSSSGSSWDEGGEEEDKDSASEEEMELERHESIRGLKRKCNRAIDSDNASENVPDAQDLNNSERRQNGTGGSGGSRDDKNGGGDKKKKKKRTGPYKGTKKSRPWKQKKAKNKAKRRDPVRDLYKRTKKNKNSRKKNAQKKAKQDEDWTDGERQIGTGGGSGSGDGKNGGDGKKKRGKGHDEGTKIPRPLLYIEISTSSDDDKDEDT